MLQSLRSKKVSGSSVVSIAISFVLLLIVNIISVSNALSNTSDQILLYVENGVLYKLSTVAKAIKIPVFGQNNHIGILHINHNLNEMLLVTNLKDDLHKEGELWIIEKSGIARKISDEEPIDASLSPNGKKIAFVSDHEKKIKILDRNGALLDTLLGRSWGTVVWSHDGNKIAYVKLGNPPCNNGEDIINSELCRIGIALFDFVSNTEIMLTDNGNDYSPVSFSSDDSKLYINSSRPYEELPEAHIVSVWLVDIDTKRTKRLTNHFDDFYLHKEIIPSMNKTDTVWSLDGRVAFSSRAFHEGTWMFSFTSYGDIEEVKHVADGDSPRWIVPNQTIGTRIIRNGKSLWQPISLQ